MEQRLLLSRMVSLFRQELSASISQGPCNFWFERQIVVAHASLRIWQTRSNSHAHTTWSWSRRSCHLGDSSARWQGNSYQAVQSRKFVHLLLLDCAGLPLNWTSRRSGDVETGAAEKLFPQASHTHTAAATNMIRSENKSHGCLRCPGSSCTLRALPGSTWLYGGEVGMGVSLQQLV